MTVAYIAIGSNLASPLEQVNAALKALGDIPESHILAVSSFYRTPPLGPQDQPDYLTQPWRWKPLLHLKSYSTTHNVLSYNKVASVKRNAGGRAHWISTSCYLVMK